MENDKSILDLVRGYKQGELQNAYSLWISFEPLCTKWAYYTHMQAYDASDLLQQSYVELIGCLERYKEGYGVPFESYYKIHLYGWRANELRKKREDLCSEIGIQALLEEEADKTINIAKEIEDKLMVEKILEILNSLKIEEREMILEHYLEQKTVRCMAEERDMKYKTLQRRLLLAIKKVKKKIGTSHSHNIYTYERASAQAVSKK